MTGVLRTLVPSLLVEGLVVAGYAHCRRKPLGALLATASLATAVTQWVLWMALVRGFREYLATLLVAEVVIVVLEALALYAFRANALAWREALALSVLMNGASFAVGMALPV